MLPSKKWQKRKHSIVVSIPCSCISIGPSGYECEQDRGSVDGDVALVYKAMDYREDPVLTQLAHRAGQILVPQVPGIGGAVVSQNRWQILSLNAFL